MKLSDQKFKALQRIQGSSVGALNVNGNVARTILSLYRAGWVSFDPFARVFRLTKEGEVVYALEQERRFGK